MFLPYGHLIKKSGSKGSFGARSGTSGSDSAAAGEARTRLRISAAALIRDCRVVFALNSSNWLAASAEPRCSLEAVARAVFERHTRGATYDATRSGCEWWAQARTRGSHRPEPPWPPPP